MSDTGCSSCGCGSCGCLALIVLGVFLAEIFTHFFSNLMKSVRAEIMGPTKLYPGGYCDTRLATLTIRKKVHRKMCTPICVNLRVVRDRMRDLTVRQGLRLRPLLWSFPTDYVDIFRR
jgi:hypothetical protein